VCEHSKVEAKVDCRQRSARCCSGDKWAHDLGPDNDWVKELKAVALLYSKSRSILFSWLNRYMAKLVPGEAVLRRTCPSNQWAVPKP
jgi:hypothetical protein